MVKRRLPIITATVTLLLLAAAHLRPDKHHAELPSARDSGQTAGYYLNHISPTLLEHRNAQPLAVDGFNPDHAAQNATAGRDIVSDSAPVVLTALDAAAQSGTTAALALALQHDNSAVREQIVNALAELDDESAMPILLSVQDDPEPAVRLALLAVMAPKARQNRDALNVLGRALADTHSDVREEAVFSLASTDLPEALEYLRYAQSHDSDPGIRVIAGMLADARQRLVQSDTPGLLLQEQGIDSPP